ncbi:PECTINESTERASE [Salix viminalis]|uniref:PECTINESTERASE n=1 Tax=Salix viminalis TaxID=40686 RepID=A0A9Q0TNR4_SALVM|nr:PECTINESTERASE [Salix viminalis]
MSVLFRCAFHGFQDTLYTHSNRQFYRDCDITGTVDFISAMPPSCSKTATSSPGNRRPTTPTYLGRPWKDYSTTTVIMQSDIGPFLRAPGWISWVSGVDPPATLFYAEYQNTGPAANVDGRVRWAGYRPALTVDEAERFTVGSFIRGSEWLPATTVTFQSTL